MTSDRTSSTALSERLAERLSSRTLGPVGKFGVDGALLVLLDEALRDKEADD